MATHGQVCVGSRPARAGAGGRQGGRLWRSSWAQWVFIHETKIRRPLEFRGDFLGDLRAYDGLCQSAFCDNPESRNLVILVAR